MSNIKLPIRIFTVLFFFPYTSMLLNSQDVSIPDFRIPETKYQRLLGGLSGGFNRLDNDFFDHSYSGYPRGNETDQSFRLNLNGSYIYADFNEERSLEFSLDLSASSYNQTYTSKVVSPGYSYDSKDRYRSYQVNTRPFIRYSSYLTPDFWHWFAEGNGSYFFEESWINSESSNLWKNSNYNKDNAWNTSLSGGLGYGKVRDGSSVFAVTRIINKIQEDSLLLRPLAKEEILRLVNIMAKKNEYAYSQNRYTKFLMEDIFSELQKMGVLKNYAATAYSVLRATEVLSERIEPRLFGWRGRLGVQRIFYETVTGYSDTLLFSSSYYWDSRDFIQLSFDCGYPVSLNTHLSSSISISVPGIDYRRKVNFRFTANCIYQLGEKIDAVLSFSGFRTQNLMGNQYDQDNFKRSLYYSADISFRFFIENDVSFDVDCSYWKNEESGFSPASNSSSLRQSPQITFGINYRFI